MAEPSETQSVPEQRPIFVQAATTIEADDPSAAVSDNESAYGTDSASNISTSISSSIRDYEFENGRRYHKFRQGRYNFPNDDQEQEREEMKHAMVLAVCEDRLHFAPLGDNPGKVIDLGTGVGSWCIDFGERYPEADVLGIDLSPIQPQWVPPNVRFMVDDAEDEWLHPDNHFDFVHARHMTYGIKDYPKLLSQALQHLKPGGYLEFHELNLLPKCDDGSMPKDWPVAEYIEHVREGLANLGLDLHRALKLAKEVRDAGFVNVEERIINVPIGPWAKDKLLKSVGAYLQAIILDGLQQGGYGPLCRGLGWTREKVEVFLTDVRKAAKDSHVHAYYELYIIYGQKANAAATATA